MILDSLVTKGDEGLRINIVKKKKKEKIAKIGPGNNVEGI